MTDFLSEILENAWWYINHALLACVDAILFIFPSTPAAIKPATVINSLSAMFPLAPWTGLISSLSLVGAVLAGKLIWRIVLELIP